MKEPVKPWAMLLCLILPLQLLAYTGPLQPSFDAWIDGDRDQAEAMFKRAAQKGNPLASLNALLIELDRFQADTVRDSLRLREIAFSLSHLHLDSPLSDQSLYHSGRACLLAKDTTSALHYFDKAYRGDPKNTLFSRAVFELLLQQETWALVLQMAQHQVEARPDNPFAWYAMGKAQLNLGFPRKAFSSWKRGCEVFPLRPMLEEAIPLALELDRDGQVLSWMEELRLRYATCRSGQSPANWLREKGREDLLDLLPPERENARYEDTFPQFFPQGREWHYSVRFGFIPLGTLVVGVGDPEWLPLEDGSQQKAWRVYYKIDSNPAYRWVIDLHDRYESLIPEHCLHSEAFVTSSQEGENRYDMDYEFNYESGKFRATGYHDAGDIFDIKFPLPRQLFDGLSILFAARRQVLEGRPAPILTVIDEEVHRTLIIDEGRTKTEIMGIDRRVRRIRGEAEYQGIAGLTGSFQGQFSDDLEALPLWANFQIAVGSVTLELVDIRLTKGYQPIRRNRTEPQGPEVFPQMLPMERKTP
jgi:hypothetical protein